MTDITTADQKRAAYEAAMAQPRSETSQTNAPVQRRALIIVDVQRDFCEGGALAVTGGNAVAERIANLLMSTDRGYAMVVTTRDWHIDPGAHFSATPDFVDSWPVHCKAFTAGAQFHPAIAAALHNVDFEFTKGMYAAAYSGFEGVGRVGANAQARLAVTLQTSGIEAVDVVGIATDYCVKATAVDAAAAGFKTRVLLDLTAAVHNDEAAVAATLLDLHNAGVEVTVTADTFRSGEGTYRLTGNDEAGWTVAYVPYGETDEVWHEQTRTRVEAVAYTLAPPVIL
jgi:nicotinamidase/pyrazinamidase